MFGSVLFQFFFEYVLQFQCNVRIFASVAVYIFRRKVAHVLLVLAFGSYKFVDVDGLVVQIDFRQIVHVVSQFGLKHVVGKHGVEKFSFYLYSVVLKDNHIVLDILSYFHGIFIFVKRAELIDDF